MNTMDSLGLVLAIFIFVTALDRLRRVNWRSAKPEAVLILLFQALWALFSSYIATNSDLRLWQMAGLLAILVWLHFTRTAWRNERVPTSVRSQSGPLGPPEFRHTNGKG